MGRISSGLVLDFYLRRCEDVNMKIDIDGSAFTEMEAKAEEAARLLATLANAKRLLALCHLLQGEKSVGQLAELIDLAPTALSQHLARMRDLDLVATRREGQTIFYRLASAEIVAILETLYRLYCAPATGGSDTV
jgi:DNA-binding transcriptional ArsR family regulator